MAPRDIGPEAGMDCWTEHLNTPPLLGADAVVRLRRDVLDAEDLEPGPLTKTSTFWRPWSIPLRAAESAVTCAANGVDLREPLKPAEPADSHAITLPSLSVRATIVLLNDVLM